MEILDLYDKDFKKTGKTIIRRVDEIPEDSYIMLSYVLIKNNDKYLLEQMTERNNYKYAIPGGHILSGETGLQGLIRELKEEIGLSDVNIKYLDTVIFPYNKYIFNVYLIEDKINIDELVLQPDEVINVNWYSVNEINDLIQKDLIPKGYAYILNNYLDV